MPVTRIQAFAWSLVITLVLVLVVAWAVAFLWYPDYLFRVDGGWQGLRLIVAVQLVTGPLLTLILYKPGKKGLLFDLTIIGMLQAVCLAAGTLIVYLERPLFLVYYDRHLYSLSADSYTDQGITPPDPLAWGRRTPVLVQSVVADNPIDEAGIRRILYQEEIPAWIWPATYRMVDLSKLRAEGISALQLRNQKGIEDIDRWLQTYGSTTDDFIFVPIHARYQNGFLAIRKSDGAFLDVVDFNE